MNLISKRIFEIGVVPVIKLNHPERDAVPLAKTLCLGGLPVAEVTFRAQGADRAIALMRESCPEMIVGAGTVLTVQQVEDAVNAGAQFIVSPGFSSKVVECALNRGLTVYPGCTTPTEYQMALEYGLDVVKFFPAEQAGGIAKIKALAAPFPMLKVMPTGGISLGNLETYLSCSAVCACGGSYMVKPELIESGAWDEIAELCRQSVEIVRKRKSAG